MKRINSINPSRPDPGRRQKINLKGLKGLHETFWGTTKKCENEKFKLIFYFDMTFWNVQDGKD